MKPLLQGKQAGQALKSELWVRLVEIVRKKGGYVAPAIVKMVKNQEIDFFNPTVFFKEHRNFEFNGRHYGKEQLRSYLSQLDDDMRNYTSE